MERFDVGIEKVGTKVITKSLKIATTGRCESAAIMLPLKGPFVKLGQDAKPPVTWLELIKLVTPTPEFDIAWGNVVYQCGDRGEVERCAYWYDTSD